MSGGPVPTLSTGVPGLDDVLGGGFPQGHLYWVEGPTGTGKTTLALQFVLAGAWQGEAVLYVTLNETPAELRANAASHGWCLDGVTIHEVTPEDDATYANTYTVFAPDEVELSESMRGIEELVERLRPTRVVVDAISELRLMARDTPSHRRQLVALRNLFARHGCTVLVLDEHTADGTHVELRSLAHGIVQLDQQVLGYGGLRRRARVVKLRGTAFLGGEQDVRIEAGGLLVYPRLVTGTYAAAAPDQPVSSAIAPLDRLLGGGLHRGDSMVIAGPAGTGKSTLAMQYAAAAGERGERSLVFLFEESVRTYRARAEAMNVPIASHIDSGCCQLKWVEPALVAPGVFAHDIRAQVERRDVRLAVIDSVNGYVRSMPEEPFLDLHLRELLAYLGRRGVVTILTYAQGNDSELAGAELSHLADVIVALRYFEAGGTVRQAISVLKHRSALHERTIREFRMGAQGIEVGDPVTAFAGVLGGVPRYTGPGSALLGEKA